MQQKHINSKIIPFVIYFLTIFVHPSFSDTLVSPADPRINYYGRFDIDTPSIPWHNWSGVCIEANLPGPLVGFQLIDDKADYEVEIDGTVDTVIRTNATNKYIIRSTLSENLHLVRLVQRSENHYNRASFRGFYLADGKVPGPAPQKPTRKIEFIGDSYTAGYGIESTSRNCAQEALRQYTNVNKTFAGLVTKAFHAQSTILAWSGAGVVRNYGDPQKRSANPYPSYYDRLVGEASTEQWDFTRWIPDLVVICLGTNDFSTTPHPDDSMYVGDYHKLIARIISNYPAAYILCVATNDAIIQKLVTQIVTEETTTLNHSNVFSAVFPPTMELSACDWHPSITDNRTIATNLIDAITKKLDWDTAVATSIIPMYASIRVPAKPAFTICDYGNTIIVTPAATTGQTTKFNLLSLSGRRIMQTTADADGRYTFPAASLPGGVYMTGNSIAGWQKIVVKKR